MEEQSHSEETEPKSEWSNRTPAQRASLDKAVLGKLGKRGMRRSEVRAKFGASPPTERMVSDSLKRLVRSGKAISGGPRNAPVYSKGGHV